MIMMGWIHRLWGWILNEEVAKQYTPAPKPTPPQPPARTRITNPCSNETRARALPTAPVWATNPPSYHPGQRLWNEHFHMGAYEMCITENTKKEIG